MSSVEKVGMAVIGKNKLLLVKKKGLRQLILPGGKKEGEETAVACLQRELKEELDVAVIESSLQRLGTFAGAAAGMKGNVRIELYAGMVEGTLQPQNEIEGCVWFGSGDNEKLLSPIVKNRILPFLRERRLLTP